MKSNASMRVRRGTGWVACVLALLLIGVGAPGHAESVDEARTHYRQATKLFDLGRYREAAAEYALAFESRDDSAFLFNQAQALRLAGDYKESIRAYRSYLRREPKARNRADIEARIVDMQRLLADSVQEGPPRALTAPADADVRPAPVEPTPVPPTTVTPEPMVAPVVAPLPIVAAPVDPARARPLALVEQAPPQRQPHRMKTGAIVGVVVGCVLVVGLGVGLGVGLTRDPSPPSSALGSYQVFK